MARDLQINSTGKFIEPKNNLDCGNSGTTMRLVSGILSGMSFKSTLIGDISLSQRPMKRIIEPLQKMGANIISKEGKAPLKIIGSELSGINYISPIASAQVKSCLLLAGLFAKGKTTIIEPYLSRNHSEIILQHMGAQIEVKANTVSIQQSELQPINMEISGDISSATYFIIGALIVPYSKILLRNIGLNPTRTGIIEVVKAMGGQISILDKHKNCGEEVGDISVEYSHLKGCTISGEIIPRLIDEIPAIAVLATQAEGTTIITNAQDLRNKESDRITATVNELKKLGANIQETQDGMIIEGKTKLKGDCIIETYNDHRIAMSLYVAGLITEKEISINNFEWTNISFPTFEKLFEGIKK